MGFFNFIFFIGFILLLHSLIDRARWRITCWGFSAIVGEPVVRPSCASSSVIILSGPSFGAFVDVVVVGLLSVEERSRAIHFFPPLECCRTVVFSLPLQF